MAFDIIQNPEIAQQAANALAVAHAPAKPVEIIDKSRVCLVVIHQGMIHYRTALWIEQQTRQGVQTVFYTEQALLTHDNGMIEKYLNCAAARNNARIQALETSAEWFMFLDADVVPPINAIDHFLLQKTPVRGGWYPIKDTQIEHQGATFQRWVAGRWVADNVFYNYMEPHRSGLFYSDVLPAGCCMMDRSVVELVPFEHGTQYRYTDYATGSIGALGECGMFGNRLHELGETTWMNPAVICEHESLS